MSTALVKTGFRKCGICLWIKILLIKSDSLKHVYIFKTAYIGKLTFLLPFSRQEIHEKHTKNKGIQCAVPQVVLVKNL